MNNNKNKLAKNKLAKQTSSFHQGPTWDKFGGLQTSADKKIAFSWDQSRGYIKHISCESYKMYPCQFSGNLPMETLNLQENNVN